MLMERLFSSGIIQMGPSWVIRNARKVCSNPAAIGSLRRSRGGLRGSSEMPSHLACKSDYNEAGERVGLLNGFPNPYLCF